MPPDNWCTMAFAKLLGVPSEDISSHIFDNFETFSSNSIFSYTVSHGNNAPSWKIRSVFAQAVNGFHHPVFLRHMNYQIPVTILRRVFLPQPNGPTIAKNSPSFICKVKSSKDNLLHKSIELLFLSSFLP